MIQYLGAVYEYLYINGGGIPWTFSNIHVHNCAFAPDDIGSLFSRLIELRAQYGDVSPIYAGEWGVTHHDAAFVGCMQLAYTSLNTYFDGMFYFQHPNHIAQYADCCSNLDDPSCQPMPPQYPAGADGVYGLVTWDESSGIFRLGTRGRCQDWSVLNNLYSTNPGP